MPHSLLLCSGVRLDSRFSVSLQITQALDDPVDMMLVIVQDVADDRRIAWTGNVE